MTAGRPGGDPPAFGGDPSAFGSEPSGAGGDPSGVGGDPSVPDGAKPAHPGDLAHVDMHDHDGVPVAVIRGEVDISNVDDITRRLIALPNFAPGLVVDLRLVEYMDSTGISLLHDLATRLRERSQQLIVVCPPGSPPRRVLELTGLITRTTVVDDLAPAVQAMRHVAQDLPSS